MELQIIDGDFSICKIDALTQVDFTQEYVFLSKTPDEISLICKSEYVPPDTMSSEAGWKSFKVTGILDFGMVGVIAHISDILAKAKISIFVVSTYNTDYVLLKKENFSKGIQVLADNGYDVK